MTIDINCVPVPVVKRDKEFRSGNPGVYRLCSLIFCCLLTTQVAHTQATERPVEAVDTSQTESSAGTNAAVQRPPLPKQPVESELIVEGLGSFGHYHIFADTWWSEPPPLNATAGEGRNRR